MHTAARHTAVSTRCAEPAGSSNVMVRRPTTAVQVGLIASLVLLVGVRLFGFHVDVAEESAVVGLVLVAVLMVSCRRSRVGRA